MEQHAEEVAVFLEYLRGRDEKLGKRGRGKLAKEVAIDRSSLTRLLNGKRSNVERPTLEKAAKACKAFRVLLERAREEYAQRERSAGPAITPHEIGQVLNEMRATDDERAKITKLMAAHEADSWTRESLRGRIRGWRDVEEEDDGDDSRERFTPLSSRPPPRPTPRR